MTSSTWAITADSTPTVPTSISTPLSRRTAARSRMGPFAWDMKRVQAPDRLAEPLHPRRHEHLPWNGGVRLLGGAARRHLPRDRRDRRHGRDARGEQPRPRLGGRGGRRGPDGDGQRTAGGEQYPLPRLQEHARDEHVPPLREWRGVRAAHHREQRLVRVPRRRLVRRRHHREPGERVGQLEFPLPAACLRRRGRPERGPLAPGGAGRPHDLLASPPSDVRARPRPGRDARRWTHVLRRRHGVVRHRLRGQHVHGRASPEERRARGDGKRMHGAVRARGRTGRAPVRL